MFGRPSVGLPGADGAEAAEAGDIVRGVRNEDRPAVRQLCGAPFGNVLRSPRLVIIPRGRIEDRVIDDGENFRVIIGTRSPDDGGSATGYTRGMGTLQCFVSERLCHGSDIPGSALFFFCCVVFAQNRFPLLRAML